MSAVRCTTSKRTEQEMADPCNSLFRLRCTDRFRYRKCHTGKYNHYCDQHCSDQFQHHSGICIQNAESVSGYCDHASCRYGSALEVSNESEVSPEKLVPFMALLYIVPCDRCGCTEFWREFLLYSTDTVYGAFNLAAVTGGVIGSFFLSLKKVYPAVSFPMKQVLHRFYRPCLCCDTSKPVKQGTSSVFSKYLPTRSLSVPDALVILVSGVPVNYGAAAGAELTIPGFTSTYGNWVSVFTAVAMCCFAFSTIIGWDFTVHAVLSSCFPRK